jgi:glucose-6-phosphate 1-dehydrogenase
VEQVRITWDETISLEGRAGYYDQAGALKDMIQNHLLQLLCLVGMEAPLAFHERDLRDRKVDVLRAVRRLSPEAVERLTIRGRYTSGEAGGQRVPNYVDEPGVEPDRGTETFAQVTLWIDNWRWSGVPVLLRTGKALAAERREIAIHFKPVPHLAFAAQDPPTNVLRLGLDPDSVSFGVNLNGAGDPFDLEQTDLRATFRPQAVPAYGRLLLDVLEGDCALSIRGDEAEESWRIVEPILAAWSGGRVPLREYAAGSDGPEGP